MTPLGPLLTSFFRQHLPVERGLSPHTCETYAYAFRLLLEYAADRIQVRPSSLYIEQIDAELVVGFLEHIETHRNVGATTRNSRLAAIKSFMRYVEYRLPSALNQVARIRAIPHKRHDHPLVRHLSMAEVQAILNAPDISTRPGIRDRAMLHLCFAGGLRVSELIGLPLTDLALRPSPTIRVRGKGRKDRQLPLWKETTRDIRAWLAVRGEPPTPELFVNARGGPLSRDGFQYVLAKHARAAAESCPSLKSKKVSPHQLRHSCALMMLRATRDIRKVALWLGHADLRSTEQYLRADPTEKLEAVEAAVPLSLRKGRFKAPDALIASLMGSD